jgi:hypothetical protein
MLQLTGIRNYGPGRTARIEGKLTSPTGQPSPILRQTGSE